MKEVTFEQAKKLSDFGFTEISEQAYLVNQKSGNYKLCGPFGKTDYNQNNGRGNTNKTAIYYSAPTVSQALQWVRDNMNIICWVQFEYYDEINWYGTYLINDEQMSPMHTDCFDTFPEAEHALLDALLIYIEKKQLNKNK